MTTIRIGERFGALTVIEDKGTNHESRREWRCRCDCGAETVVLQSNLLSGKTRSCGCRIDSRRTVDDYTALAEEFGIAWRGTDLPRDVNTKTLWYCPVCGHTWQSTYNVMVRKQAPCPRCNRERLKKGAEDYHTLAGERGFRWLGDKVPPNTLTPTLWGCGAGHKWQARYNAIQRGTGCPECYRLSRRKG